MPHFSENMRGAFFMVMAMLFFTLNDTVMKMAMSDIGVFQAVLIRGVVATCLISSYALMRSGPELIGAWRETCRDKGVILRTAGEVFATVFFLIALFHMPIANASAILQSLPLLVTLAAAVFFKEKVGWRRYSAIIIGMIGVLIIIRPGADGFNAYSIYVLIAALFVVLRDLATRRISPKISTLLIAIITSVSVTVMGAVVTVFQPWQSVDLLTFTQLAASAALLLLAYMASIQTMRLGEVSFTSPFRYTSLIWAIMLGYFAFGDIPDTPMIVGSIIVIATGLFTFYRERKLERAQKAQ